MSKHTPVDYIQLISSRLPRDARLSPAATLPAHKVKAIILFGAREKCRSIAKVARTYLSSLGSPDRFRIYKPNAGGCCWLFSVSFTLGRRCAVPSRSDPAANATVRAREYLLIVASLSADYSRNYSINSGERGRHPFSPFFSRVDNGRDDCNRRKNGRVITG